MAENKLDRIDDFKRVLASYQPNPEALATFQSLRFVVLVAPTSGGRNVIINELVKTGNYDFVVSDTTRKPRLNDGVMEKTGVEYHFRSEDEMLADLEAGKFLEAELIHNQQVSGLSMREIEKAALHDKIAIADMDIAGGEYVASISTNARVILVTPPSFDVWMERFKKRGPLSQDEMRRRLMTAETVLERALDNPRFWFLRNDELKDAVAHIRDIIENNEPDYAENASAKQVAWKVLGELKAHLNS